LIATLSTNLAANIVSPANGFSNLAPSVIGFRGGAMITAVIGILIMPWRLMTDLSDYIFVWLIGYSALLGPIAGIMLCDYFIVRRTELNADALYDPEGEYAGVSVAAMLALVFAVLPNLPGFINAVTATAGTEEAFFHAFFDQIYGYAWFIGLPLAMLFYLIFKILPVTGDNAT
ncbi:MAG: cytosine permease, partial [Phycisphaerales bacterium]|nr:cytosine permease [Phycisphaerales bacterium]